MDTTLARSALAAVSEVTGGCFCCRFEDLMNVANQLIDGGTTDTIIAEAVGSCTDLQETVIRPLRKYHGDQFTVAPLTTVVDPQRLRGFARATERGEPESDLSYLFSKQLTEADIIAVNKIDKIDADAAASATANLWRRYPTARIVPYSARTGVGLPQLLTGWRDEATWSADLDIDYDRYAAAEARLAWLNQRFTLQATNDGFNPTTWARAVLSHLLDVAAAHEAEIGHAKLTVDTDDGTTKMSITGNGGVSDQAITEAIARADTLVGARSSTSIGPVSFKPGYPRPAHRLSAHQT
ncbi:MAG: GTP-binding protein [Pseudonocardiaceae bacterium]